jgi:hypothetical protein
MTASDIQSRMFGSLDWRGEPVDDGTNRVVDNRTVVIFKEFPKVTFDLPDHRQNDHVRSRNRQGLFHLSLWVGQIDGLSRQELAARALRVSLPLRLNPPPSPLPL